MTEPAVIVKNRTISPIWILPIIALSICGWLIYNSYQDAGVEIAIYFNDASGIVPGKTQILARGIPVGLVQKVVPDLKNQQIKAIARMEQEVVKHLVEDTQFWIVRPQLSASSVQGLDTIFSGSYIGIQVGSSTKPRLEYVGLASSPPVSMETPGLHLQLSAETLGSIQVGTGIYYRNIEIGKVQSHRLEKDEGVLVDLFIEPEFSNLVRQRSRFCNISGLQISGKLPNVKVKMESLASLIRGGILLHTPTELQDDPPAKNGQLFSLYPDYESGNYGIPMTLTLFSGEDIVETNTKVIYRGLEAGFVQNLVINDDEQRTVTAHILLDPRAELALRESTKFWLVKPEITPTGIHNLGLLLSGAHITFQPGKGQFRDHFEILPEPPALIPLRKGKTFILLSEEAIDIGAKSPVYFKNIQVGEVVSIDLDKSAKTIRTSLYIYEKYLHLLSKKSVFWSHSGLEVDASFERGLEMSTGPLAALLNGGISFTTPDKLNKKKNFQPPQGFQFPLYTSYKDAVANVPYLQPMGKHFLLRADDASSLSIGAPILHKNIKIGEIDSFQLTADQNSVLIDCFVYKKFEKLIRRDSRFFNLSGIQVSGGLNGIDLKTGSLQSILAGGIGCINIAGATPLPPKSPYPLFGSREEAVQADDLKLTVYLQQNNGLKIGSPIKHKGIEIGTITALSFTDNIQKIRATVRVKENMAPLFRADSLLWVEQAEVKISGVKNLQSLLFGSYLNILPGYGPPVTSLNALDKPPQTEIAQRKGLAVVLETKHLGSLTVGSPVYYRQVQVGEVTGYELSPTFQNVRIFISILTPYSPIIRKNTRFWNVSGAKIEGGIFSGLSVSASSLEAIIRGGIALATPDKEKTGPAVTPGHRFTLYDAPEKGWLDWSPNIIVLERESERNLSEPK